MDVTPLLRDGTQILQSYAGGRFRISGLVYEGAVIVLTGQTQSWTVEGSFPDLELEDFSPLIKRANEIDVVLLGCGPRIQFLPAPLQNGLKANGLNIDVMDTGAACRTYNVLMAEGRRVAAALLPFTPTT